MDKKHEDDSINKAKMSILLDASKYSIAMPIQMTKINQMKKNIKLHKYGGKMSIAKSKSTNTSNEYHKKAYDLAVGLFECVGMVCFALLINTKTISEKSELVDSHLKNIFLKDYDQFVLYPNKENHKMVKEVINDEYTTDFREIEMSYQKCNKQCYLQTIFTG